jgi:hypothetical protein
MNLRTIIRQYRLHFSIILFIVLFTMIHFMKPGLVYNKDGSFRKFGVGVREKTVISIWIVAIVLAILCYVGVGFYAYSI